MKALIHVFCSLVFGISLAADEPLLNADELRRIPLDDAIVLDPAIDWPHSHLLAPDATMYSAIETNGGFLRAIVAEPGKFQRWQRILSAPIDVRRYPFVIVTYRAWNLAPEDRGLLSICTEGCRPVLRNREVVADGEVHEEVLNLPELGFEDGQISHLWLSPCCAGPGPAAFDLLGLRFETDGRLPPADRGPATERSVRVTGLDGTPLPGATVTFDADILNAARSAVTDADGKATVQVLGLPGDNHTLRVVMEGMAPVTIAPSNGEELPDTVVLLPGTRYGGIVRNEEGEPVPNVSVVLSGTAADGTKLGRYWHERMLTDDSGQWSTSVLPDDRDVANPMLRHPDYQSGSVAPDSSGKMRQGKATLTIRRGVSLLGTVLTPDNQPLTGAEVRFVCLSVSQDVSTVKTSANGSFSFDNLTPGRQAELLAQHPGYAPALARVAIEPGTTSVTIRLEPPRQLTGQVVDCRGEPVSRARLRSEYTGRWHLLDWHVQTDRQGKFAWDNAPTEEFRVRTRGRKCMSLMGYPVQASDKPVQIVLPPILEVRGKVTDATTKHSLGDCRVSWASVPPHWTETGSEPVSWYPVPEETSRRGRYRITVREARFGHEIAVRFAKEGYEPVVSEPLPLESGKVGLDIALAPAKAIEGRLLLPNGRPVAGAMVYLAKPGHGVYVCANLRVPRFPGASARTDDDGRFRLFPVFGTWRLAALSDAGYAECDSDAFAPPGELTLRPWAKLEGVYLREGKPMADCLVEVRTYPYLHDWTEAHVTYALPARTDAQGHFTAETLPEGLAVVFSAPADAERVFGPRSRNDVVSMVPGETARLVIGAKGRTVVGQFVATADTPQAVSWASLYASLAPKLQADELEPKLPEHWQDMPSQEQVEWERGPGGQAYRAARKQADLARHAEAARKSLPFCRLQADAEGRFRLPDLPPATYTLKASVRMTQNSTTGPARLYTTRTFTVTAPSEGTAEPFDLGTLEMSPKE